MISKSLIFNPNYKKNHIVTEHKYQLITNEEVSWIDLPPAPLEVMTHVLPNEFFDLNLLIKEYHLLVKTKWKLLFNRIEMLDRINNLIMQIMQSNYSTFDNKLLSALLNIALRKKNYLEKISLFYENHDDSFESIEYLFNSGLPHFRESYVTKNDLKYNPFNDIYYGHFWLEAVDPCHRELAMFRYQWDCIKEKKPIFFLWLEDRIPYVKQIPWTRYIPSEELASKYQCTIINGVLKKIAHGGVYLESVHFPLNEKKGLLFVKIQNGPLFLSSPEEKNIRHTSFSHGKPVDAAGLLWAINGFVSKIFFMSGHYAPDEKESHSMLSRLLELDISINDDIIIQYYSNEEIVTKTFNEFYKKKLN